ncbi:MAG: AAA family ATPase [Lachnospiraceae bacterium]|nr:AAA family ATPase [Lachnospiraceae bacterium]
MNNLTETFWEENLRHVLRGESDFMVENPSIEFTRKAKAGEYDKISDEEYNELLNECETVSGLWKRMPRKAAGDLLLEGLKSIDLSIEDVARAVTMLSGCPFSEKSDKNQEDDFFSLEILSWSPKSIYRFLDKRILGQDEAKKAAALVVYNHVEGRRSNTIFCGPTGSGKSEIWRQLEKNHPKLVRMVDASRLSADGWKGSFHLRDIFEDIQPQDIAKYGLIVVLDEADKITCETISGANGTNYAAIIQNALLKMLDGDVLEFGPEDGRKPFKVDCAHISVVLLGAFENLLAMKSKESSNLGFGAKIKTACDYSNSQITPADLINAGMRREIVGRINRISALTPLSVNDFKKILTGPVLADIQEQTGCQIEISDSVRDVLAEEAAATGLGVRYMRSRLMNALDDLIYEDPEAAKYHIDAGQD